MYEAKADFCESLKTADNFTRPKRIRGTPQPTALTRYAFLCTAQTAKFCKILTFFFAIFAIHHLKNKFHDEFFDEFWRIVDEFWRNFDELWRNLTNFDEIWRTVFKILLRIRQKSDELIRQFVIFGDELLFASILVRNRKRAAEHRRHLDDRGPRSERRYADMASMASMASMAQASHTTKFC